MFKKVSLSLCLLTIAILVACSKGGPASPTSVPGGAADLGPGGSTLKIAAPSLSGPADGFAYGGIFSQNTVSLTVGNVSGRFASFPVTLEVEVRNPAGAVVATPKVAASSGATTNVTIPNSSLEGNTIYTWRARATYNADFGPWSSLRSFRTAIAAGIFGQIVIDPLTNGMTFGKQRGGRFIQGQGWMSDTVHAAIDYDITPTCESCTLEFDITNISKGEGECCAADLKFISMGSIDDFSSFFGFRDSPWKMQFAQRADGDGTGFEIIWRNGEAGEGDNPGDHAIKIRFGGPDYEDNRVFHFVLKWDHDGYVISAAQDGGPQVVYLEDGFDGIPYAPPNHRISLGCYPRGESFPSAIYRNVRLFPH